MSARRSAHDLLAAWLEPLLPAEPARVGQMCASDSPYKYQDVKPYRLTRAQLEQHARGVETFAATLHGADERARMGAIDVDHGGRAALLDTLHAGRDLGLVCCAIEQIGAEHQGGTVWFLYAQPAPIADIVAQLRLVADAAGLPADVEIWPRRQILRLPFGYHKRNRTRGRTILPSGEIFENDQVEQLGEAVAGVLALPMNDTPPAAPQVEPSRPAVERPARRVSPGEAAAERATLAEVRSRFNAEHSIESLLADYGATAAPGGYTCPCGVDHTHQTTLYISKKGKLFSYSPRCNWHTSKGWDAFGLYVLVEHHNNIVEALRTLNPIASRGGGEVLPPAERPPLRLQTAEQAQEAARKRAARRSEALDILADVEQRAAGDALRPSQRALLDAMLAWCKERGTATCTAGRSTLARLAGLGVGTVRREIMELARRGYFVTSDNHGGAEWKTAKRTFTRGSPGAVLATDVIPDQNKACDLTSDSGACEGGREAEPPIVISVGAPDQRGMCLVRWSDGSATWQRQEPESPAVAPVAQIEPAGASYNPAEDFTARPARRRQPQKDTKQAAMDAKRRRCERLRAMLDDPPALNAAYWKLKNKIKKCVEDAQRSVLGELLKEIEHYRDLAYARRDAPDDHGDPPCPRGAPLTSSPALGMQQALFSG